MEVEVLKESANELEIKIDNLTIAEILRVYLHKDPSVELAAWRREHPTKPLILRVETKGKTAKKAVEDTVKAIEKETEKLVEHVKKA